MGKPLMFDLDGTLFQAHLLSLSAFRRVFIRLKEAGLWDRLPSDSTLMQVYGMTENEVMEHLLPGATEFTRRRVFRWLEEEELANLDQGLGALFPGVVDALTSLRAAGHSLFVISNGTEDYVKGVCHKFGLAPLLTGMYSAGEYCTKSKTDLLALAIEHHRLARGIMIGDRDSDIEAGRDNGFITVGCTYGYGSIGELKGANYIIEHIRQMVELAGKGQNL